jgi:hypothetical protein
MYEGRYILIALLGQTVTLLQCPCGGFTLIRTRKLHKVHLCEECEHNYIEPASAHLSETGDAKFYIHR